MRLWLFEDQSQVPYAQSMNFRFDGFVVASCSKRDALKIVQGQLADFHQSARDFKVTEIDLSDLQPGIVLTASHGD